MKRFIVVIVLVFLIIFFALIYIEKTNKNNLEKLIKKNYADINLYYVNKYDGYYIFISDKNYGVLDKKYNEVMLLDKKGFCLKKDNYDIIYRKDELMYLEEVLKKNKLTFNYYDINTCDLIESISIGG